MSLRDEAAFPCSQYPHPGMDVRTWLAGIIAAGLAPRPELSASDVARHALEHADALIRELEG